MRRRRTGRCQHDFQVPGRLGPGRTPAAIGAGLRRMNRATDPLAGIGGHTIDIDRRTGHRTIGLNAARCARHQPAQCDGCFRDDLDPGRFMAGDEFVDLAERARMKSSLAMIDGAEHEIGRALQCWAFCRHAGRRARLANKAAVGLRIFVEAVAAQRQERRARRHLVFALVETAQERAAAVELAAESLIPIIDAMVRNAAQHRMTDIGAAAAPDIATDRIAAARIADQRDPRRTGAALQLLDGLSEFAALVLGRGTIGLLHLVVGARQRIGEIDREHPIARHAVGFHPPHRGDPERRMVAIAMHEKNRRHIRRARRGRRRLRQGLR